MKFEPDAIDALLTAWSAARPDLDPSPLALVGRVIVLAEHLERSVEAALAPHQLTLGQFDILATLRRQGPRGALAPGQLLKSVMLSSGGMTSRLDKLEVAGWIVRKPDPTDRRGVVVELTSRGCKRIDAATASRFREAAESQPKWKLKEKDQLADLLRRWLNQLTSRDNAG